MALGTIVVKDGNGASQTFDVQAGINNISLVSLDGSKATYRYAGSAFSMVAAPTAAIVIQGSATKTVRIKHIWLTGAATAAGTMPVVLTRRSAAGSGGAVLTAVTAGLHDTADVAATATVSTVGTANYTTLGTSVATMGAGRLCFTALATGVGVQPLVWDFSTRSDKALVLRGSSQYLTLDFSATAIPAGGVLDYEIELEEDAS